MLDLPFNRSTTYSLLLVVAIAAALMWGEVKYSSYLPDGVQVLVSLGSVVLGVGGFAALCKFCRCRFCGYRLFWHAVGERDHSDSMGWFITARHCPKCGRAREAGGAPRGQMA